jgi:hypothetical protein
MVDYTTIQNTAAESQRVITALTSQATRHANEVRAWLRAQVDPALLERARQAHAELARARQAQRTAASVTAAGVALDRDPQARVAAHAAQQADAQQVAAWVLEAQRDADAADRALASAEYAQWIVAHRTTMAQIEATNTAVAHLDLVEQAIRGAEQGLGGDVGAALRQGLGVAHGLMGGDARQQALAHVAWLRRAADGLGIPAHVYWTLHEQNAGRMLY